MENNDYRDLFDNVIDAICILDVEGNFLDVNVAMTELSGMDREEMLKMNVRDLVHQEDVEQSKAFFTQLRETGFYTGYNGKFIHKDGSLRYIEISSKAFYNSSGDIIGSRDIIRDITEKKKIELELINSEEKFRTVISNSQAVIFILDGEGVFTLSEGKGLKALGLSPGEVVGSSVFELYKDFPDILDAVAMAMEGKSSKLIIQLGDLHFDTFYSPYRGPSGESLGIIGLSVDITDQIEKEKELDDARRKAEESDHLKSAFLANMSHEIRTPMNAILGFSGLLAGDKLSRDEKKTYAEIVNAKGKELLQMLTDLIDISKIEAGIINISKTHFNLSTLLYEYIAVAKQEVVRRNLHQLEILQDIPLEELLIISDENKVRQILNNLLVNAIKFTKSGTIKFGFTKNEKEVIIYVSDTGIGMSPEQQEVIFDRFRQVDDDYNRSAGGTGLGLYISKTLVRLLNGRIWLESDPGKGSTFYFSLLC